jgi:glycosyltransferase involved in cell wall biosynthesis
LTDGENALLFDDQRAGSFEAALTRLCADDALRTRLAEGARQSIRQQNLTWLGNAKKVVGLVQSLPSR